VQRGDHLTRVRHEGFPVAFFDCLQLPARGTDSLQALAVDFREVEVAIHRLLGQNADAPFLAFEAGKLVNAFDGRQGAVTVEEDQVEARPAGLLHRLSFFYALKTSSIVARVGGFVNGSFGR